MKLQRLRLLSLIAVLAVSAFAASKSQTFAGEVSDAMCGAKHMMPGNAACLRTCVSKGANYALVVAIRFIRSTPPTRPRVRPWTSWLARKQM